MKNQHLQTVQSFYPQASSSDDAVSNLISAIQKQTGLKPRQLMFADSFCCDDVNSIQYPQQAHKMLGPFKMGGLNGFPFAGVTGMGAFAHHVPEDGAIVIIYAPHIGVSANGNIGEIHRIGQSANSACCGAAKAALGKLVNNQIKKDNVTELDYQMNTIEQIFLKEEDRIKSSSNQIFEATEVMYEAIDKRIELLVEQTKFPCKYVILVGAIYINGDEDMGSFFNFKKIDCIDMETKQRVDLLKNIG